MVQLAGCSFATLQTARPVGPGRVEIEPQLAFQGFTQSRYPPLEYPYDAVPIPQVDCAFRFGVTTHLDVGTHVGISGAELGFKVLLTPDDWERFAIGFAPAGRIRLILRGNTFTSGGLQEIAVGDVFVPLLFEFDPSEQLELVASPKALITLTAASRFAVTSPVVSLGGSLAAGVWFNERLGLLVEAGMYTPVVGGGAAITRPLLMQVAIGFRIRVGGKPKPAPEPEPEPEYRPAPPPPPAPLPWPAQPQLPPPATPPLEVPPPTPV